MAYTRNEIIETLKRLNIPLIEIEYSGSDDDGGLNFTTGRSENDDLIDLPSHLSEAIDEEASDILNRLYGGWTNNEGSDGKIVLNVAKNEIKIYHNKYYKQSKKETATETFLQAAVQPKKDKSGVPPGARKRN